MTRITLQVRYTGTARIASQRRGWEVHSYHATRRGAEAAMRRAQRQRGEYFEYRVEGGA